MANISTEQALQLPQQLQQIASRDGQQRNPSSSSESPAPEGKRDILGDEHVTLAGQSAQPNVKKISLNDYKSELGSDSAYINEVLRTKLSEYGLSPSTQLSVFKNELGQIELKGSLLHTQKDAITKDLQASQSFQQAFDRVQAQQPTLDYVDNVVKISKAYGVNNTLFQSLISENKEYNGLNDIAHRYEALKGQTATETLEEDYRERFNFVVN